MPDKLCIAMSGGVDSSVCALLLARAGTDCVGATMRLGTPEDEANIEGARAVCDALDIPHRTFDMTAAFQEEVIEPFVDEHAAGLTPNPCVRCNTRIKFGAFLTMAAKIGCSTIATGHYLRKREDAGRPLILRAADAHKDQSYFLCQVPAEALAHALFPLGSMTKSDVKALAREAGLPTASRTESQDICFVPGNCAEFLQDHLGTMPGRIVNAAGQELGSHEGAYLYTIGQRKGLGVALGHPAYVCAKDADANEVVIGDLADVEVRSVEVSDMNWLGSDPAAQFRCTAKLRYNMAPAPCVATCVNGDIQLSFDEAVFAPAPGQAAALYDGDLLLGGGTII